MSNAQTTAVLGHDRVKASVVAPSYSSVSLSIERCAASSFPIPPTR